MMHSTKRDWPFFREVAREKLWPELDPEYQQELEGIVEGLNARSGSQLDVYDIVALDSSKKSRITMCPGSTSRKKRPTHQT